MRPTSIMPPRKNGGYQMDLTLRLPLTVVLIAAAAWVASANPGTVSAHSTDAVSLGGYHTCALSDAGTVRCWGWNAFGQVGDGTRTDRYSPVGVEGLGGGVAAVTAGYRHACALTTTGGVKCWGDNGTGQLGDGTTTGRTTRVDVVGLGGGVSEIAAGQFSTCALTDTGAVKCWGLNGDGQLGDGTTIDRRNPVNVIGLGSGVVGIAAGGEHACAVLASGSVRCWGENSYGQLGDGTTTNRSTPVSVPALPEGAAAVVAGESHTCVRTRANGAKRWGWNSHGELGDGTVARRTTPVDVAGLASNVAGLTAGDDHTCAVVVAGGPRVQCWGANYEGELGDGSTTNRSTPSDVVGLGMAAIGVGAGRDHTCAFTTSGRVVCWGRNDEGQLGDGTTHTRSVPAPVPGIGAKSWHPLGDVSCNGDINSIDAVLELQLVAGLLVVLPCDGAADMDRNGFVNSIDALLILQTEAGLLPIPL